MLLTNKKPTLKSRDVDHSDHRPWEQFIEYSFLHFFSINYQGRWLECTMRKEWLYFGLNTISLSGTLCLFFKAHEPTFYLAIISLILFQFELFSSMSYLKTNNSEQHFPLVFIFLLVYSFLTTFCSCLLSILIWICKIGIMYIYQYI